MNGAAAQGGVFAVKPTDLRLDLFAQGLVFFDPLTGGYADEDKPDVIHTVQPGQKIIDGFLQTIIGAAGASTGNS
jgi:hypothetical protein